MTKDGSISALDLDVREGSCLTEDGHLREQFLGIRLSVRHSVLPEDDKITRYLTVRHSEKKHMKTITVPAALIREINAIAIKLNKDELIINVQNFKIQWKPLNVNTLEPRVTDYIIRVIRLSKSTPCLSSFQNCR